MTINVVLDIHDVLACTEVRNIEQASFFKNKGAIITAVKTHYVFPGVIEFIKVLFQTENVKVSFFSSSKEEVCVRFVEQLLKSALGESKYADVKQKVKVLSRNDLTEASDEAKKEHFRLYGLHVGNMQKNIAKVLGEGESLENAVLMDDDKTYVEMGQARNFLSVPCTNGRNFEVLRDLCRRYQPEGFKFLRCIFANESVASGLLEYEEDLVKEGRQILIIKTKDGFNIGYVDKESKYQSKQISSDHPSLLEELNKIHRGSIENSKTVCYVENKELVKNICLLVESWGGRNKKICRQANRIYYAAGLFFTALKEAKAQNITIAESLFRLQFKLKEMKEEDDHKYEPVFRRLSKMEDIYVIGLQKLREVNSTLQFTTPHSFVQCVQLLISGEDRSQLEAALKNQGDNCSIM